MKHTFSKKFWQFGISFNHEEITLFLGPFTFWWAKKESNCEWLLEIFLVSVYIGKNCFLVGLPRISGEW